MRRGGHDSIKVYNAYKAAFDHKRGPTVILAKTVKGYGLGPSGGERWASSPEAVERLVARRERVSRAIGEFCASHHIEYWDSARMAALRDTRPASRQGDDLHMDREGHRRAAEHYLDWGVGLVTRAIEHSRGVPAATN